MHLVDAAKGHNFRVTLHSDILHMHGYREHSQSFIRFIYTKLLQTIFGFDNILRYKIYWIIYNETF